jgi:putative peptidoglycan lipid II flippase
MTRLFYSLEEVKTPVRVGAIMVGVNLVLNILLVFPLKESGLALATSVSAALNLAVLTVIATRKLGIRGLGGVFRSFLASLALAILMGAAVFGLSHLLSGRYPERLLVSKLLWVFPPILLGMVLYLGTGFLFRRKEFRALRRPSQERTAPEDDDTVS